jgi:nucleotide-binding universal stress UspA family protein
MDSPTTQETVPLERPALLHRVVVASALDEAGRWAVRRAARLPLAPGARIEVVHVRPPWSSGPRSEPARGLEAALAETSEVALRAGSARLELVARELEGWPAREIVRAAWHARADLVVVGPPAHRRDGSPRATIARLLRWAELPVLVVRQDPVRAYGRALCAVDRTPAAADTIALAARLAPSRPLTLFHAYDVPFAAWLARDAAALEAEAIGYLRDLTREVGPAAQIGRALVRRGDRCLEIVRAAAHAGADLVVVGTRGRAGLARALSASAASWVSAHAPVDVAVARRHGLALRG